MYETRLLESSTSALLSNGTDPSIESVRLRQYRRLASQTFIFWQNEGRRQRAGHLGLSEERYCRASSERYGRPFIGDHGLCSSRFLPKQGGGELHYKSSGFCYREKLIGSLL